MDLSPPISSGIGVADARGSVATAMLVSSEARRQNCGEVRKDNPQLRKQSRDSMDVGSTELKIEPIR